MILIFFCSVSEYITARESPVLAQKTVFLSTTNEQQVVPDSFVSNGKLYLFLVISLWIRLNELWMNCGMRE